MDKYLISVDLDDTLLTSEKIITQRSREYIRKITNEGHRFIINTGRPFQGAVRYLKALGICEPMVVNNGGAIVYFNETYSEIVGYRLFPMEIGTVVSFHREVRPFLKNATVTSLFDFYTYDLAETPFWVLHESKEVHFREGNIAELLKTPPIVSEYYVWERDQNEFEKILKKDAYQEFRVTRWGNHDGIASYEISAKNSNKGEAMKYLAETLGIPLKNTIAFGDQLNDLPMLNAAEIGVAMCNAGDKVKSRSRYVTDEDFNHDGVVEFLKKLFEN